MTTDPAQLLRMLGSAAGAPALGHAASAKPSAPFEAQDFAALLKQARGGETSTGLPVTVQLRAGVTLDDTELARLSVACDKAEAAGIHTALVMLDGKSVILDVHTRSVKGPADLSSGVLSGVDGVLDLTTKGSGALPAGVHAAAAPALPTASTESLIKLLASRIH